MNCWRKYRRSSGSRHSAPGWPFSFVTLLVTPLWYNSTYEFVQGGRAMCGRYTLVTTENLAARFDIQQEQLALTPRYNVAPSQSMPVVVRNSPNRLVEMQWGLIPSWSKEPRAQFSTINARAETVTKSPVFRGPFKSRRCLVPASGFYEWQRTGQGKQPFCIRLKGGDLFAFAGLYDVWHDPD